MGESALIEVNEPGGIRGSVVRHFQLDNWSKRAVFTRRDVLLSQGAANAAGDCHGQ